MTVEEARQILGTGVGDVATAYKVYYGQYAQSVSVVITPADPPTLYAPGQAVSADPTVFTTDAYSKALNLSSFQQQANWENQRRYALYLNAFNNWKANGHTGNAPAAPAYEVVDATAFETWWTTTNAALRAGQEAPSITSFVSNAPAGA